MDFSTKYLGLNLPSPIVASAGPISQTVDGIRSLAAAGCGAVVLWSLFAERLAHELSFTPSEPDAEEDDFGKAWSYFEEEVEEASTGSVTHDYLRLLEKAVKAVKVPVIGSLNAAGTGNWVAFAERIQDAGAAAIELNIYAIPGDVHSDGSQVVERHLEITKAVVDAVDIPVAVKMSPFLSSPGNVALRVLDQGAAGVVLFNRLLQPDIDLDRMVVKPSVDLSTPVEGKLPRTWISALRNHTPKSLALTTGVETGVDVIKGILAGADVVMTTSALVRHGSDHVAIMIGEIEDWMRLEGYTATDDFRGIMSVPKDAPGAAYQRAGYVAGLTGAMYRYRNLV